MLRQGEFNPSLLAPDRGLMGNASHLPSSNHTAVIHATLRLYHHIIDGFPFMEACLKMFRQMDSDAEVSFCGI